MRDPALKAAGVTAKYDPVPNFTGTPPSIGCSMSDERFSMTQKPYELPVGQVTEWRFARLAFHPLHVHINPFQLIRLPEGPELAANTSMDGGWYEAGDFFDTIYIPQLDFQQPNATEPNRLPLRFNPGPYYGDSVTHCHFLNHEDSGCMHMIKYTCPDGTVQEQYPYRCSTTTALKGTFEGGPGSTDPSTPGPQVRCTSIRAEDECLARDCAWDGSVCNSPAGPAEPSAAGQVTAMVSASAAMLASLCLLAV